MTAAEDEGWQLRLKEVGLLHDAGRYREGAELMRKSLRQADSEGAGLKVTAELAIAGGTEYHELGMDAEAMRLYLRALRQIEDLYGKRSPAYALQLCNLAAIDVAHGRLKDAELRLREAVAIYAALALPDDVRLAIARCGLGQALLVRNALDESDTVLAQSRAALEKSGRHEHLAIVINNQAALRRAQGRPQEAAALFEESLNILEESLGREHPHVMQAVANLAVMYADMGRWSDADRAYRRAIAIGDSTLGAEHPIYGNLLSSYARFLRHRGRKAEAKPYAERAKETLRAAARRNGDGLTVDVSAFRPR